MLRPRVTLTCPVWFSPPEARAYRLTQNRALQSWSDRHLAAARRGGFYGVYAALVLAGLGWTQVTYPSSSVFSLAFPRLFRVLGRLPWKKTQRCVMRWKVLRLKIMKSVTNNCVQVCNLCVCAVQGKRLSGAVG